MSDPDDKLSHHYGKLPRDEPPPAVDAAILSAAARAVHSRPRRNWAGPVSIAAVLVLGIGVSVRMQMEQPGVETALPPSEQYGEQPSPPPAADVPAQSATSQPAPAKAAPPARTLERRNLSEPPIPAAPPRPFADSVAPSSPPPALAVPASPPPAPAESVRNVPPAAPPAAEAAAASRSQAAPARAKREDAADTAETRALMKSSISNRAAELDRIARLRADARHDEADKALDEFRRRHPDYRIPEDVWERVKPR